MARLEDTLQKRFVQVLRLDPAFHGIEWFAVPNEGQRSPRTGAHYKAMGMQPGVADLCFVLPDGRAAFMELKSPKGRLSEHQRDFRDRCAEKMIPHAVCRSLDECVSTLKGWINASYRRNAA